MKLNLINRKIKFFPPSKDITIIEIKNNDLIYNEISFLDYDMNYRRGYLAYKNAVVFIIEHPNGDSAECGCGVIVNVNNYEFDHDISTEKGASGSPIILYTKNINSLYVIGIHKEANFAKKLNSDTFIGEIFYNKNYCIPNKNNKANNNNIINNNIVNNNIINGGNVVNNIYTDNYIIDDIDIKDEDVNKDIKIINS